MSNSYAIIKPGSIILTDYTAMSGKVTKGFFYVLYSESLDSNTGYLGNLLCLKITSKAEYSDNYCFPLPKTSFNFLSTDSFVMCSKPNVIKLTNDTRVMAEVYGGAYRSIYKMFHKFLKEIDRQLMDYL